jgi:predicted methyltransferase MtxX (methanogen marker protein 4)
MYEIYSGTIEAVNVRTRRFRVELTCGARVVAEAAGAWTPMVGQRVSGNLKFRGSGLVRVNDRTRAVLVLTEDSDFVDMSE